MELQKLYIVECCVLWVCLIQGFVHHFDRSCASQCESVTHSCLCLYGSHVLYVLNDDLIHFIPYFHHSKLTVGDLKVQNPQTKFNHPLNMSTTRRFVFCSQFCHEGLFKQFVSLMNSLLNIKKKKRCNFSVP